MYYPCAELKDILAPSYWLGHYTVPVTTSVPTHRSSWNCEDLRHERKIGVITRSFLIRIRRIGAWHQQTNRQTNGRTNIEIQNSSTQKAPKGAKISFMYPFCIFYLWGGIHKDMSWYPHCETWLTNPVCFVSQKLPPVQPQSLRFTHSKRHKSTW